MSTRRVEGVGPGTGARRGGLAVPDRVAGDSFESTLFALSTIGEPAAGDRVERFVYMVVVRARVAVVLCLLFNTVFESSLTECNILNSSWRGAQLSLPSLLDVF